MAGIVGALLALAIDSPAPEVVTVDRVIEVPATEPLAMPSEDDIDLLVADYRRLTSDIPADPFANSLIEELAGNVCEFAVPTAELYVGWASEVALSEAEFADFYDEIAAVCPAE